MIIFSVLAFNFCQENNGECSHLCLLSAEQHRKLRRLSCACPDGMNLLPDNKTCNTSGMFAYLFNVL